MMKLICIGLLSAVTAACGGSLFRSNAPSLSTYLLSVKPAAAPPAEIPVDLSVLSPRIRTGLDTDHIAVLYPDRRLDYFAGARWSGSLDEVMQDLVLQSFRTYAHVRNVHTDTSVFGAGYWVEIEVVDFQAEYASGNGAPPTVHVRLLGRVGNSADRLVLGHFEADVHQPAADNRLTAVVDAYDQAAGAALGQIVLDTAEALKSNSVGH